MTFFNNNRVVSVLNEDSKIIEILTYSGSLYILHMTINHNV